VEKSKFVVPRVPALVGPGSLAINTRTRQPRVRECIWMKGSNHVIYNGAALDPVA